MPSQLTKERARRRRSIAHKSDGRCWYCGGGAGEKLAIDHVLPKSQGGIDDDGNLVLACQVCNSRKGTATLEKFRRRERFREIGAPVFTESQEAWLRSKGFDLDLVVPQFSFYGELLLAERRE